MDDEMTGREQDQPNDTTDLQKAVDEKRMKLRNERTRAATTSSNGTGENFRGNRLSSAHAVKGSNSGTPFSLIGTQDNRHSTATESKPVGSAVRRHGENNGTTVEGTPETTRADTIVIDRLIPEDIPETVVKRKRGRPRKNDIPQAEDQKSKKRGKPLSPVEAESKKEQLQIALDKISTNVDRYIWHRTQDASREAIWSDMEVQEEQTIAHIMLRHAQQSRIMAAIVNFTINSAEYLDALSTIVPRVIKTTQKIRSAPKREKLSRAERLQLFRKRQEQNVSQN